MAEELLINVNVQGDEQIPGLDKKLDNVNKTAGKTKDAFSQMRTEMRNAKADMLTAAEGTDKYNDAMKRAALAADKMRDMNDKIKASQRDVGVVAKNVTGMVSGLAGAFGTAQGIIGLFGIESDNVTKAILKVTQVMQVTSGIAQLYDSFDNMKDIFLAVKLRIAEMTTTKVADTVVTNTNTTAQVANAVAINATGTAAVSTAKKLMMALGPYALIAAAIAALIYGVSKLIEKINEVPEDIKLNIEIDKEIQSKLNSTYEKAMKFAYDYNRAVKDGNKEVISDLTKRGNVEFGLHQEQLDLIAKRVDKWKEAFDVYLEYAKQTYKLESLYKLSAENEVADSLSKGRIKKAEDERNTLINTLKEQGAPESFINRAGEGTVSGLITSKFGQGGLFNDKIPTIFKELDEATTLLYNKNKESIDENLNRLFVISKELDSANKAGLITSKALEDNKLINSEINKLSKEYENTSKKLNSLFGKSTTGSNKQTKPSIDIERYTPDTKVSLTPSTDDVNYIKKNYEEIKKADKDFATEKGRHQEAIDLINARAKMGETQQIISFINEEKKKKSGLENEIKNEEDYIKKLKGLYDEKVNLHNNNVVKANAEYNNELSNLNVYETEKARITVEIKAADAEFAQAKKDGNIDAANAANELIQVLDSENKANDENIENAKKKVGKADEKKKGLVTVGEDINKTFIDKNAEAIDFLIGKNGELEDSEEAIARATKEKWQSMAADAQDYIALLQGLTNGVAQLYEAQQKQVDSQTAGFKKIAEGGRVTKKEEDKLRKTDAKTYNAAIKAKNGSDKDRADFVKQIEMDAWEVKSKLFEKQKLAEKAAVLMNTASGIIGIWSRSPDLGLIAGPIVAAVQSAALIATAAAQIKTINAQRLDSPSESLSNSSSAPSGASFAALTPSQTTMTTSQENLNMMNASNKVETVVKVSEINEVQNTVRVRENNSSY